MVELSVKRLLYADDQTIPAPSLCGSQEMAFGRQPIPTAAVIETNGAVNGTEKGGAKNAPDPQLFPFLARRLGAKAEHRADKADEPAPTNHAPGADEYIAAATVLAMKYGPKVLEQLPPAHLVISRSARDEHSYSGCEERNTAEALLDLARVTPPAAPAAPARRPDAPRALRLGRAVSVDGGAVGVRTRIVCPARDVRGARRPLAVCVRRECPSQRCIFGKDIRDIYDAMYRIVENFIE
ncbi:hypothetical protein EVAR_44895_1 [Eumeta japonica]|uniref:Uncharacterized protein n=1 Tax=Eumeta variegata TaxID=151549 RepID=A0A4C1XMP4_EUMVA|nr:hypothetical protein EVAR_44895_1 [Eumeta japonica]